MILLSRQQSLYGYVVLVVDPGFTRPAHPQLFRNRPKHGRKLVAQHVEKERRSVTRLNPSVSITIQPISIVLTTYRSIMSEEQYTLRGLQAIRNMEEWQGEGSRRFVLVHALEDRS